MKLAGRGRFDAYPRDQGDGQAGPSHDGWPALLTVMGVVRVKCTAPSKSPKKVAMKMVCQMQMQQQVQQQAGHPMLMCVFLPSASMGVLKPYKTSQKSLNAGSQEWEHLSREVRAVQALYTYTGRMGETQMVLMQPAQATGIAELPVPQILPSELRLKNAGVALKDQAMAQNLLFFGERERPEVRQCLCLCLLSVEECRRCCCCHRSSHRHHCWRHLSPQQPPTELQLTKETAMDMGASQGDEPMTDGSTAQQLGSQGPTEDADAN